MICVCLSLAIIAAPPAPAPKKAEPKAIRKVGKRTLYGGELVVTVTSRKGYVGYKIARRDGALVSFSPWHEEENRGGTKMPERGAWFIYPVSAREIWVFSGSNDLRSFHFTEDGFTIMRDGTVEDDKTWRTILKRVPKTVKAELPEKIRKLEGPKR